MAKVLRHLSRYQRMVNFADQSMAELEERMEDFKAELELWRDIRESIQYGLRICPHCHGEGKIRVLDASLGLLSEEEEDCPRCAGSGQVGQVVSIEMKGDEDGSSG